MDLHEFGLHLQRQARRLQPEAVFEPDRPVDVEEPDQAKIAEDTELVHEDAEDGIVATGPFPGDPVIFTLLRSFRMNINYCGHLVWIGILN